MEKFGPTLVDYGTAMEKYGPTLVDYGTAMEKYGPSLADYGTTVVTPVPYDLCVKNADITKDKHVYSF